MTEDRARLGDEIAADLPYLRRYARALTGSQERGDRYALSALEAVVAAPEVLDATSRPKVGLFRALHKIWSSSGALVPDADVDGGEREARAQTLLRSLAPNSREALLLGALEGFGTEEIGEIMEVSPGEARELLARAEADMSAMVAGDVLIIEDEAIIAMDLRSAVTSMGHRVIGVARTQDAATKLGRSQPPDLILADIQLADKSSGIDAVAGLINELGPRPVIFITAFPERLLTGERPEPAFLITKPYSEEQVRAAVSQAMFFASTAPLAEVG